MLIVHSLCDVWCQAYLHHRYSIQTIHVYSLEADLMVAGLGSLLQQAIFQTVLFMCSMASVAFGVKRVEQLSIYEWLEGVAS